VKAMALQAIQTAYAGYLFRSRLEARWAVFFDTLGIKWQYEPEGFRLPSGKHYLPDFRLMVKTHGEYRPLWVEIKPLGGDSSTLQEFIGQCEAGTRGTVLHDIPDPRRVADGRSYYDGDPMLPARWDKFDAAPEPGWDAPYTFCACPKCGEAGFEYEDRAARIGCGCFAHGDDQGGSDSARIARAFAAARSARFEHEARETFAMPREPAT
jgi:hypothetical protein